MTLKCYLEGQIWFAELVTRCFGFSLPTRTTVVRLKEGGLWLSALTHPDEELLAELRGMEPVRYIVAPSTTHGTWASRWQRCFPSARVYACPGLSRSIRPFRPDALLSDRAETAWAQDFDQVRTRGNRWVREVVFFHKPSSTLLATELFMNLGVEDVTSLTFLAGTVSGVLGKPSLGPLYQHFTIDRRSAEQSVSVLKRWDVQHIVPAHGAPLEGEAVIRQAMGHLEVMTRGWESALAGQTDLGLRHHRDGAAT